jgi:anti-anti-sigma regulatory factor
MVRVPITKESMTLKIQKTKDGDHVVLNLSGRMHSEHVAELLRVFGLEVLEQNVILDLTEISLVDRDGVMFLARCEENGTKLRNCPRYIREWIMRERRRFASS